MASNSLFSSDHIFSSEFTQIPPASLESSLMWNQEFILPSSNFDGVLPFPEQHTILPMIVKEPILLNSNELHVGFSHYSSSTAGNNISIQHQSQKAVESLHFQQPDNELSSYNDEQLLFSKTCREFLDFDHAAAAAAYFGDHNIWGIHHNLQGNNSVPHCQTSSGSCSSVEETKVRRYSKEERNDRILKYLKKKNQRNFNKTIKYVCRKTLADRRIRVRGKFARNNEYPGELSATTTKKNNNNEHQDGDNPFFHNSTQETKQGRI